MSRIYVAGFNAPEDALRAALGDAEREHPDATLVFNRAHPAGNQAAQDWITRGLPIEPVEDAGPPAFVQDEEIIDSGVVLVIACTVGTRPEGRSAGFVAERRGIPVVRVGGSGLT